MISMTNLFSYPSLSRLGCAAHIGTRIAHALSCGWAVSDMQCIHVATSCVLPMPPRSTQLKQHTTGSIRTNLYSNPSNDYRLVVNLTPCYMRYRVKRSILSLTCVGLCMNYTLGVVFDVQIHHKLMYMFA